MSIGLGIIVWSVLLFVLSFLPETSTEKPSQISAAIKTILEKSPLAAFAIKYTIYYGTGFMVGGLYFLNLNRKFEELWPAVEIQIGPDHTLTEKSRRNQLYIVTSIIIFPLLYDIFKMIVGIK